IGDELASSIWLREECSPWRTAHLLKQTACWRRCGVQNPQEVCTRHPEEPPCELGGRSGGVASALHGQRALGTTVPPSRMMFALLPTQLYTVESGSAYTVHVPLAYTSHPVPAHTSAPVLQSTIVPSTLPSPVLDPQQTLAPWPAFVTTPTL